MTGDTYKEQLDKTLETSSEDMNYFCIAAFGEKELKNSLFVINTTTFLLSNNKEREST